MSARRLRRAIASLGVMLLSAVLLLWTLLPIYNIIRVSMQEKEEVLSTSVYPIAPSTHAFSVVFRQAYWLLETFWNQMGNSFFIGVAVALVVLTVGSLTSFTISRMRIRSGWMLTNAALLTYVIPLSFLAIPFYGIMGKYGLTNNPLSVIAVEVTFATTYAIFIFQQYGASIPLELDEAARIDGASPPQIFFRIYLPLMAPALVAIGTYALLLSWNEYLYAFLLLSKDTEITLPVALGNFLAADDSPWELLMTTGFIYALPPAAIYYAFKRYMVGGLTAGAVKS
jgi:multiple sugar transport system permease protein